MAAFRGWIRQFLRRRRALRYYLGIASRSMGLTVWQGFGRLVERWEVSATFVSGICEALPSDQIE